MAKTVSNNTEIPLCTVLLVYESFWTNIKNKIKESNIDNVTESSESDFPMSYNIGSIGKLYTNKEKIIKINKKINKSNENIEY